MLTKKEKKKDLRVACQLLTTEGRPSPSFLSRDNVAVAKRLQSTHINTTDTVHCTRLSIANWY